MAERDDKRDAERDAERDGAWLLARERGEAIGDVPADRREAYDELGRLIARLPDEPMPEAWKLGVLAAIDAGEQPTPRSAHGDGDGADEADEAAGTGDGADAGDRADASDGANAGDLARARQQRARRRRALWLAAGALAAAAVVVLVLRRGGAPVGSPPVELSQVDVSYRVIPSVHRADPSSGAAINDTLEINARGPASLELRVYGPSGRLWAECAPRLASAECTVIPRGALVHLTLRAKLRASGEVSVLTFAGDGVPPSTRERARDIDAAQALRARVEPHPSIIVR